MISDNAKEAVFAQQTDEVFVYLLTITSEGLATPIRVCSDPNQVLPTAGVRGIVSNSQEYVYLPFQINLPTQDDTGVYRASLAIDNTGRDMVQSIRTGKQIYVTISVVMASNPDFIELEMPQLRLERVTYDAFTISGDLSMDYYDLEPFPSKRYTPSYFEGIF